MPAIERVHAELGDRIRFVGIDSQDEPAEAAAFAASIGVTYELWSDELGDVFAALDLTSIPTTLFLDRAGRIVATHTGALDEDDLRDRARRLLGADGS
jgi:thiol-disulfide isomerase/thioredoxin